MLSELFRNLNDPLKELEEREILGWSEVGERAARRVVFERGI